MCGIFAIFNISEKTDLSELKLKAEENIKLQSHRGPDGVGFYESKDALMYHQRLAIISPEDGDQPFNADYGQNSLVSIVNGEIYNEKSLESRLTKNLKSKYGFELEPKTTHSDCEIIQRMYYAYMYAQTKEGVAFKMPDILEQSEDSNIWNALNGIFAFAIYDKKTGHFLIGRDPVGVCPLYMGVDDLGQVFIASEMKTLMLFVGDNVQEFPIGSVYGNGTGLFKYQKDLAPTYETIKDFILEQDYSSDFKSEKDGLDDLSGLTDKQKEVFATVSPEDRDLVLKLLRREFTAAVKRQMASDVPFGVLLSGGLDSSLVAYCASQMMPEGKKLHTFSIGLEGSPDLKFAEDVANHIGSIHHSFVYTIEEGILALPDVIHHIETYDVTSIRASTPMYLMAKKIHDLGFKMVLSGEGSDEIFGGYLYFHKAPNAKEFHDETKRKLEALHNYDCLRANKSMMAWSVEARVPFLDLDFLSVSSMISPELKMVKKGMMEKQILRDAFKGTLPDHILYRQKEQFSDGVGYGWIDSLKDHAEKLVLSKLEQAAEFFDINTPETNEALLYRIHFAINFETPAAALTVPGGKTIACSSAKAIEWDESFKNSADPSGRSVMGVHEYANS